MRRQMRFATSCVVLAALLAGHAGLALPTPSVQNARGTQQSWTLNEALAQLMLFPEDAYLQYVALQLARREGRFDEVYNRVASLLPNSARNPRAARRDSVDLFSIFTGALAVQESLQLDTMRAVTGGRPQLTAATTPTAIAGAPTPRPARQSAAGRRRRRARRTSPPLLPSAPTTLPQGPAAAAGSSRRPDQLVAVSSLKGPTVKSHPWEQLLGGRKPIVSPLAYYVPDDFYLVEFRSLSKLLEVMDASDLWGTHFFNQAYKEARTHNVSERLKRQLAMKTEPVLRPFYDLVVESVAVTGSDPFAREGSDVTVIFRLKQPQLFKARMDAFLEEAQKAEPRASLTRGSYLGVDYVQLQTPGRELSVIAADPAPDLHVRSNSLAGFRRVVEAVKGRAADGHAVRRLGDTAEFGYIRTLMPGGGAEEDGMVYMSDPFIRRLVGPELKLTERRRMLCYNHLRMIGHAALLYRTEFGRWPASLEELANSKAAPGLFGAGELSCPDGGKYSLSEDGSAGSCSRHGNALFLTPNIEIPVREVTGAEADEYEAFLAEYNSYWRIYFDPIALRVKATQRQYRVETLILPLIDNSVYTGLASALGGPPEGLDQLPVPGRNIFTLGLRLNKEPLLKGSGPGSDDDLLSELGAGSKSLTELKIREFVLKGLGNQAALNIYDTYPTFDLNVSSLLGMLASSGAGRGSNQLSSELLWIGMALTSLNSPVYLSFPVQDERVVDEFLGRLDTTLAAITRPEGRRGWFDFQSDYYKFNLKGGQEARALGVKLGPAKLRFFAARIGKGLYIASKSFILDDLSALASAGGGEADREAVGHAMARVRAGRWNEVLPDFNLSWAENDREACLNNLGPLAGISRALTAKAQGEIVGPWAAEANGRLLEYADRLRAVHYFCPEGGVYAAAPDGRSVSCSVHGSVLAPRQPSAPSERSASGRAMRGLSDMTATLTFLPEGLRAVVLIDRK